VDRKIEKLKFQKLKEPLGYISAYPKPTPEELQRYYAELYYQDDSVIQNTGYESYYTSEEVAHRRIQSQLILYALKKHRVSTSDYDQLELIEVGCGEGFVLAEAVNQGFNIYGIDFSDYAIQKFNPDIAEFVEFGDAYRLLQEVMASTKKYDFCVMQNVLEHVTNPKQLIHDVMRVLKPYGLCLFVVPNDYSPTQKKALDLGLIDEETWWAPPDHLTYFNIQNGIAFVESLGFTVLDVFSTFPIDFFLFHPDSNYYKHPKRGKSAHWARIHLELLMAEAGIDKYYELCRALAGVGMGRNFALIIQASGGE